MPPPPKPKHDYDALAERRKDELAALASIFMDDYTYNVQETNIWGQPSRNKNAEERAVGLVQLRLQPVTSQVSRQHQVTASLQVRLGHLYPTAPPTVTIVDAKGISPETVEKLNREINRKAAELVPNEMIFDLAEWLRNRLRDFDVPVLSFHDEMEARKQREREEQERQRLRQEKEAEQKAKEEKENMTALRSDLERLEVDLLSQEQQHLKKGHADRYRQPMESKTLFASLYLGKELGISTYSRMTCLAFDTRRGEAVVVKRFRFGSAGSGDPSDSMNREQGGGSLAGYVAAQLNTLLERHWRGLSRLRHRHLLQVLDYRMEGSESDIMLEFLLPHCGGGTAAKSMRALTTSSGKPIFGNMWSLLTDVAEALCCLHEHNLYYGRPILLHNILIDGSGSVRLSDYHPFGALDTLAWEVNEDVSPHNHLLEEVPKPPVELSTFGSPDRGSDRKGNPDLMKQRQDLWYFGCLVAQVLLLGDTHGKSNVVEVVEASRRQRRESLPFELPTCFQNALFACLVVTDDNLDSDMEDILILMRETPEEALEMRSVNSHQLEISFAESDVGNEEGSSSDSEGWFSFQPPQANLDLQESIEETNRPSVVPKTRDSSSYSDITPAGTEHTATSRGRTSFNDTSDASTSNVVPNTATSRSRFVTDFETICFLGKGSFGSVMKARNRLDGRLYALKRLFVHGRIGKDGKLMREVMLLSRLHHNYIVRYYQAWQETASADVSAIFQRTPMASEANTPHGTSKDTTSITNMGAILFIQMEYCNGTLRELIDSGIFVDKIQGQSNFNRVLSQMLDALNYIHHKGIIHRDLNPNNVFIDANNNVKIGDFGLALNYEANVTPEQREEAALSAERMTGSMRTGSSVVGTAMYMSPELISRTSSSATMKYSAKCDMYSVGIMVLEMVHRFETGMERARSLTAARSPEIQLPVKLAAPWAGEQQYEIMRWCLQHNPEKRPTAKDLYYSSLIPPKMDSLEVIKTLSTVRGSSNFQNFIEPLFAHRMSMEKDLAFDSRNETRLQLASRKSKTRIEDVGLNMQSLVLRQRMMLGIQSLLSTRGAIQCPVPLLEPHGELTHPRNLVGKAGSLVMDSTGTLMWLPQTYKTNLARTLVRAGLLNAKTYGFVDSFRDSLIDTHPFQLSQLEYDIVTQDASLASRIWECLEFLDDLVNDFPATRSKTWKVIMSCTEVWNALKDCSAERDKDNIDSVLDSCLAGQRDGIAWRQIRPKVLTKLQPTTIDLLDSIMDTRKTSVEKWAEQILKTFQPYEKTVLAAGNVCRKVRKVATEWRTLLNDEDRQLRHLDLYFLGSHLSNHSYYHGTFFHVTSDTNEYLAHGGDYSQHLQQYSVLAPRQLVDAATTARITGLTVNFEWLHACEFRHLVSEKSDVQRNALLPIADVVIAVAPSSSSSQGSGSSRPRTLQHQIVKYLERSGMRPLALQDPVPVSQSFEDMRRQCTRYGANIMLHIQERGHVNDHALILRTMDPRSQKQVRIDQLVPTLYQSLSTRLQTLTTKDHSYDDQTAEVQVTPSDSVRYTPQRCQDWLGPCSLVNALALPDEVVSSCFGSSMSPGAGSGSMPLTSDNAIKQPRISGEVVDDNTHARKKQILASAQHKVLERYQTPSQAGSGEVYVVSAALTNAEACLIANGFLDYVTLQTTGKHRKHCADTKDALEAVEKSFKQKGTYVPLFLHSHTEHGVFEVPYRV
eukprot:Clim_evm9s147 gene=Clim_evmTU9s147